MAKKTVKRGLGRGLSALMADVNEVPENTDAGSVRADLMVPIEKVNPNPDQPRRTFEKDKLTELSASIAEKGILQPLIVRASPTHKTGYEIVAGERRWRAAQLAKLHEVPVIIREFNDTEVLEVAIIENIQRADLNPVDEAAGYRQLMEKFGHTQGKLSEVLGKSRSHIANSVRLLTLPVDVQTFLSEGKLSSGHARALITADDPSALARQVIKQDLSVRETEKLAKSGAKPKVAKTPKVQLKDADTRALEGDLSAGLGMKVAVDHKPGQTSGKLSIQYDTLDQLDDLCRILSS